MASLESVRRGGACGGERLHAGLIERPASTEDTLAQAQVFVMHAARPTRWPLNMSCHSLNQASFFGNQDDCFCLLKFLPFKWNYIKIKNTSFC